MVCNANPFTYRGYYYDRTLDLYYLKSRYYDYKQCRFISPDNVAYLDPQTLGGMNLYAYCLNNPVMGYDPEGTSVLLTLAIGALIGAGTSALASVVTQLATGKELNGWVVLSDAAFGAVSGAIGASGIKIVGQAAFGAIISMINTGVNAWIRKDESITPWDVILSGLIGGIVGAIGGDGWMAGKERHYNGLVSHVLNEFGESFSKGVKAFVSHLGKPVKELMSNIVKSVSRTAVANTVMDWGKKIGGWIWDWLCSL